MGTLITIALTMLAIRLMLTAVLQQSPNPPTMKVAVWRAVNDCVYLVAGGLLVYYE